MDAQSLHGAVALKRNLRKRGSEPGAGFVRDDGFRLVIGAVRAQEFPVALQFVDCRE
jgi:hypothetical protein